MREPDTTGSDRDTLPTPAILPTRQSVPVTSIGTARRELGRLAFILAVASLPLVFDGSAVPSTAAMYPIAEGARPYFAPSFAWLLYVRAPLVVVSSITVLLAPGLLLASALGATQSWCRWILSGLALSLVAVSGVAGVAQWMATEPLIGGSFLLVVFGCSVAAAAIAFARAGAVERMIPPFAAGLALESATAIWLILVILLPKFMWENFNGDGADALEVARLLFRHGLPFWPSGAGTVSGFPDITSMLFAYPASWFVRLFGNLEISVRLPMLLALLGAHAGLAALAEVNVAGAPIQQDELRHELRHELRLADRWLLWASLLVYTIVIAYSGTYDPYAADIAIPGAQDTMFLAMLAGAIVAFASDEVGWMALFGALTYITLPSGLLLLGMLAAAALVVWRPVPKRMLMALAALIVMYVIAGKLVVHVLQLEGLPQPGGEYADSNLLGRLMMVQFTDWRRFLYVVVPCGITPVIALFLWKRQDALARVITLMVAGYFVFTYLQAYSVLHYYIPAMLLPVALYWRTAPEQRDGRKEWRIAALAGLCGALVLSLPEHAGPYVAARGVSETIQSRVPGYDTSQPRAFLASDALQAIFPMAWDRRVPATFGGSPLVWNYYLHHRSGGSEEPNYVLQADTFKTPTGFHLLGGRNGFAVFVRDETLLAKQRSLRTPVDPGSPLFRMSPDVLFRYATMSHGAPIHDITAALARRGVSIRSFFSHH